MAKRKRRAFTNEYKAETVRLIREDVGMIVEGHERMPRIALG